MRTKQAALSLYFMAAVLLVAILMASGCASLGPERNLTPQQQERENFMLAEAAWQGLNVIDTAQTVHLAREPACYREVNPMTKAVIGEHPSEAKAVAIGVIYGWGHKRISDWLERKDHVNEFGEHDSPWVIAKVSWHAIGLVTKAVTVANNHRIGLRPFGGGCPR